MYNRQLSGNLFNEAFNASYGGLVLPLQFVYNQTSTSAVYDKWISGGEKLLQLPSVIADVTLSSDGSTYEASTEFTCISVLGVDVIEVLYCPNMRPR